MGWAADLDNEKLSESQLHGFQTLFACKIEWKRASQQDRLAFKAWEDYLNRELLSHACVQNLSCFVFSSLYFGFPDPAEFLFLACEGSAPLEKLARGEIAPVAAGFFEEWPECMWGTDPTSLFNENLIPEGTGE